MSQTSFGKTTAVADPGFPRGGGANSPGGAPTYDFANFSRKLHEIERIWTPGGGGTRPKFYYVDPPLDRNQCVLRLKQVQHFAFNTSYKSITTSTSKDLDNIDLHKVLEPIGSG